MRKHVGILGGGAAGLFTACQIKRLGLASDTGVTILEKMDTPGIKLTLTGHGRCNITNLKDASVLKKGYHEAENFIYPALREFGPSDTMSFFEDELCLPLKEEDNNRIFPVCDSAVKVRDKIVSYISDSCSIKTGVKVLSIFRGSDFEVKTSSGTYHFDMLVLSCGGSSFKRTGSTGDSYTLAESLSHTTVPVRGALAPINAGGDSLGFCRKLSGVSADAGVSLYAEGRKTAFVRGDILFADFGLTGPAAMEIARQIPSDPEGRDYYIELDFIPSMSDEEFEKTVLKLIGEHADTKMTTLLGRFMPDSLADSIARKSDFSDLYAQGFTKENRKKLICSSKHLKIRLDRSPDLDKAYVTRGGVSLKEVDRKTMQSKLVPGLYILGEALDVDGISGGYNLQACMSEAYLAAKSILS